MAQVHPHELHGAIGDFMAAVHDKAAAIEDWGDPPGQDHLYEGHIQGFENDIDAAQDKVLNLMKAYREV